MALDASSGPLLAFGQNAAGAAEYNPDFGAPSLLFGGAGYIDQRPFWGYNPGQAANAITAGWLGFDNVKTVLYVPSTISATNIAASQAPTTAVALTLASATAGGITVSCAITNSLTGVAVTGLLGIDLPTASSATSTISGNVFTAVGAVSPANFTIGSVLTGTGVTAGTKIIAFGTGAGGTGTYIVNISQTVTSTTITGTAGTRGIPVVSYGDNQGISLYNPAAMLGRNVRITTAANDVAVYTVVGYDIYGYPMSEAITANGATTVSGVKAFKYITSITPVGTVGADVTVGTGDVFGFPLYTQNFNDTVIRWNAGLITASTGYVAGVKTAATTTTGDVRGTYAVQSASDGAKVLVVSQSPQPISTGALATMFGGTQA